MLALCLDFSWNDDVESLLERRGVAKMGIERISLRRLKKVKARVKTLWFTFQLKTPVHRRGSASLGYFNLQKTSGHRGCAACRHLERPTLKKKESKLISYAQRNIMNLILFKFIYIYIDVHISNYLDVAKLYEM